MNELAKVEVNEKKFIVLEPIFRRSLNYNQDILRQSMEDIGSNSLLWQRQQHYKTILRRNTYCQKLSGELTLYNKFCYFSHIIDDISMASQITLPR